MEHLKIQIAVFFACFFPFITKDISFATIIANHIVLTTAPFAALFHFFENIVRRVYR